MSDPAFARPLGQQEIPVSNGPSQGSEHCEQCGGVISARRLFAVNGPALCSRCENAPARRRRRNRSRLRQACIPRAWHQTEFADLDPHEQPGDNARVRAINAARQWSAGDLQGLVLYGNPGSGKSIIAGTAACAAVDAGRQVRWISLPSIAQGLALPYESEGYKQSVDALRAAEQSDCGLIIEDIDRAGSTDPVGKALYLLLDAATANARPLLATLSGNPGEVRTHWKEPWGYVIASRLGGICLPCELRGRDRRLDTHRPLRALPGGAAC